MSTFTLTASRGSLQRAGYLRAPDAVNPTGLTRRGSHASDPKTQSTEPPYGSSDRSLELDSTIFRLVSHFDPFLPASRVLASAVKKDVEQSKTKMD